MSRSFTYRSLPFIALLAVACSDPAADKPKAEVKPATDAGQPAQTQPAQGQPMATGATLTFDPSASVIGFVGSKVTGSHEGGFDKFTASGSLGPDGTPVGGSVNVEIDMTSTTSDNPKLTGHLKSPEFFDVEKFATTSFQSTGIEAHAGDAGNHKITGNLTLHGVTKEISFPATIVVTDGGVITSTEFALNRKDFGINYPGRADDLIRDNVALSLDVSFKR